MNFFNFFVFLFLFLILNIIFINNLQNQGSLIVDIVSTEPSNTGKTESDPIVTTPVSSPTSTPVIDPTTKILIVGKCSDTEMANFDLTNNNEQEITIVYEAGQSSGSVILSPQQTKTIFVYKNTLVSFKYNDVIFKQIPTNDQTCSEPPSPESKIIINGMCSNDTNAIYNIINNNDINVEITILTGDNQFLINVLKNSNRNVTTIYAESTFYYKNKILLRIQPVSTLCEVPFNPPKITSVAVCYETNKANYMVKNIDDKPVSFIWKNTNQQGQIDLIVNQELVFSTNYEQVSYYFENKIFLTQPLPTTKCPTLADKIIILPICHTTTISSFNINNDNEVDVNIEYSVNDGIKKQITLIKKTVSKFDFEKGIIKFYYNGEIFSEQNIPEPECEPPEYTKLTIEGVCTLYENSKFTIYNDNTKSITITYISKGTSVSGTITIEAKQTKELWVPQGLTLTFLFNGIEFKNVEPNLTKCFSPEDKVFIEPVCFSDFDKISYFKIINDNEESIIIGYEGKTVTIPGKNYVQITTTINTISFTYNNRIFKTLPAPTIKCNEPQHYVRGEAVCTRTSSIYNLINDNEQIVIVYYGMFPNNYNFNISLSPKSTTKIYLNSGASLYFKVLNKEFLPIAPSTVVCFSLIDNLKITPICANKNKYAKYTIENKNTETVTVIYKVSLIIGQITLEANKQDTITTKYGEIIFSIGLDELKFQPNDLINCTNPPPVDLSLKIYLEPICTTKEQKSKFAISNDNLVPVTIDYISVEHPTIKGTILIASGSIVFIFGEKDDTMKLFLNNVQIKIRKSIPTPCEQIDPICVTCTCPKDKNITVPVTHYLYSRVYIPYSVFYDPNSNDGITKYSTKYQEITSIHKRFNYILFLRKKISQYRFILNNLRDVLLKLLLKKKISKKKFDKIDKQVRKVITQLEEKIKRKIISIKEIEEEIDSIYKLINKLGFRKYSPKSYCQVVAKTRICGLRIKFFNFKKNGIKVFTKFNKNSKTIYTFHPPQIEILKKEKPFIVFKRIGNYWTYKKKIYSKNITKRAWKIVYNEFHKKNKKIDLADIYSKKRLNKRLKKVMRKNIFVKLSKKNLKMKIKLLKKNIQQLLPKKLCIYLMIFFNYLMKN